MEDLRRFYRIALRATAVSLAVLAALGAKHLAAIQIAGEADSLIAAGIRIAISGTVIGGTFWIAEWFIRTRAWKIFHPESDYDGYWSGTTTYTKLERETEAVRRSDHLVHSVGHDVRIEQNCLGARLRPAKGQAFVKWESWALELLTKDKLGYAYQVTYRREEKPRFPDSAYGYEEMTAVEHDQRGRPTGLQGSFWHCNDGEGPRYSGTVVFQRRPKGWRPGESTPSTGDGP